MEPTIDLRVVELLCARLCHDLAGPVTGVKTGVELLADGGAGIDRESLDLLGFSVGQASARLQFFRVAYGAGGGAGDAMSESALATLARDMLAGGRVRVVWPPRERPVARDEARLVLNTLMLGTEALPRGGEIAVRLASGPESAFPATLTATGHNAALHEPLHAALFGNVRSAELSPRTVHAFFVRTLALRLGRRIVPDIVDGGLRLSIV